MVLNLDLRDHSLGYYNIRKMDHTFLKIFDIFLNLDNDKAISEGISAPSCFQVFFVVDIASFPNSYKDILFPSVGIKVLHNN